MQRTNAKQNGFNSPWALDWTTFFQNLHKSFSLFLPSSRQRKTSVVLLSRPLFTTAAVAACLSLTSASVRAQQDPTTTKAGGEAGDRAS
jgi:hypothetical protein